MINSVFDDKKTHGVAGVGLESQHSGGWRGSIVSSGSAWAALQDLRSQEQDELKLYVAGMESLRAVVCQPVAGHTCDPSTWEVERERSRIQKPHRAQAGLKQSVLQGLER